jgi:uncharacterized protein YjiS (DUF1127 family)
MRETPRNVRSGARTTGAWVDGEDGTKTINGQFAYHAAFSAIGRLAAAPFRPLRQDRQLPDLMPNRRLKRTEDMTKTVNAPRWAQAVVIWYKRQRMREELNALSDRVLADIGLTRDAIPEVVRQAYRPIRQASFVAAETVSVRTAADSRPAASNDESKQPLAA